MCAMLSYAGARSSLGGKRLIGCRNSGVHDLGDGRKVRNPRSGGRARAPLAQSAERLHGKYLARNAVLTCEDAGSYRAVCAK
jgi:hypothetical protein